METGQVTLKQIYEKLTRLEISMKKMDQYMEDLEFARRTAEAWEEIEEGKGITRTKEEFLKEMKSW